jgi:hypothetical protein
MSETTGASRSSELAKYTDYRGRSRTLELRAELVLDTKRGTRPLVVYDQRAARRAGRLRPLKDVVRDYMREARRRPVLRRSLQPGELAQRANQAQLRLSPGGEDELAA